MKQICAFVLILAIILILFFKQPTRIFHQKIGAPNQEVNGRFPSLNGKQLMVTDAYGNIELFDMNGLMTELQALKLKIKEASKGKRGNIGPDGLRGEPGDPFPGNPRADRGPDGEHNPPRCVKLGTEVKFKNMSMHRPNYEYLDCGADDGGDKCHIHPDKGDGEKNRRFKIEA